MKNKVACCYLTHEHPEVIEEVLGNIRKSYSDLGIDIYVYDSSVGDATEKIVEKYASDGLGGLYYVSVRFIKGITGGDEKFLYVIAGNDLNGHYDYIWPTKDRCWFTGDTLTDICSAIDEDPDVVFVADERDRFELTTTPLKHEYTDPVEFFADYGALTTNWEGLIRRTDTMLDPIDWDDYAARFNVGKSNNFNQTVSTFARLSEMDRCSIRVIQNGIDDKHYSDKAASLWTSMLYDIWIGKWIPAIYSLPELYDEYKLQVIKTQLGHVALFGSNDSLIVMRDAGQLTDDRVEQLSSMWGMISRLPLSNLKRIVAHDEKALFEELYEEYVRSFAEHDYEKGYYMFFQNNWLAERFAIEDYVDLGLSYYIYHSEIQKRGYSVLFDSVDSVEGLLERFRMFSKG